MDDKNPQPAGTDDTKNGPSPDPQQTPQPDDTKNGPSPDPQQTPQPDDTKNGPDPQPPQESTQTPQQIYGSTFSQHVDPIVLRDDACAYSGCPRPTDLPLPETVPCVVCLGHHRYCSEECLIRAKPKHMRPCMKILKDIRPTARSPKTIFEKRMRQLGEHRGYPDLLKFILQNIDRDVLLANVFFVRLAPNPNTKITNDHPVKKIPWLGLAPFMARNACLKDTYKSMLRHKVDHPDGAFVYAVTYPPDMMFTTTACMPFDADEDFEKNMQVTQFLTLCPCALHNQKTGDD